VYIPLLNGLHYEWVAAALRAGKHVLCEKPLTSNAAEARSLSRLAQAQGLVLFEAFHYRYDGYAHHGSTVAILTMARALRVPPRLVVYLLQVPPPRGARAIARGRSWLGARGGARA